MPHELERLKRALVERYTVHRELGRGGMATVYLVHDVKHDRPVALKVLKPELAAALGTERFLREITVTARLDHPHILPLLDSGEADGMLYYVMPYVDGESARDRLNREKQLPLDDALQITREVADALSYAHSHGIVHRDIKPENILLAGGHARVADFGIARAVTAAGLDALTGTGLAVGTPVYMSPEQAAGDRAPDARSDVYSLGCVAYELLAGEPPFTGATAEAILARKSVQAVPSLRVVRDAVPARVEQAITKALAKVPADRFATASQFAEALERGRSALAPVSPTSPAVLRRRLLVGGGAVLVALAAGWWITQREPPSPALSSLAVLPFANLTGNPEQQHFVDAMHDAVIAELAQIRALTVISRQSVLRYRETRKSVPEIARELGVDGVVEGSVFRAGDTVRTTVQLLQARPAERHLWAGTFKADRRGILGLQGTVARGIAERVQVATMPYELGRLARARPVEPAAYDAWLRGWVERNRLTGPALEQCITYSNKALAIDANYGPAYALAAECHILSYWYTQAPPWKAFPEAKAAAQQAIAADASLGKAHAVFGFSLAAFDWDWSGAEREFKRALELVPGDADSHNWYSFFLNWMGRHDEAIEHARRAEQLSPGPSSFLTAALIFARRFDEAIAQARRTVELFPDYGQGHEWLALAYDMSGKYQKSLAAQQEAVRLMGADAARKAILGRAYARTGQRGAASQILAELLRLQRTSYVAPAQFTYVLIGLGRTDEAIDWLERGYDVRDAEMPYLNTYPAFDSLRDHPRFQNLLRRLNFPQ